MIGECCKNAEFRFISKLEPKERKDQVIVKSDYQADVLKLPCLFPGKTPVLLTFVGQKSSFLLVCNEVRLREKFCGDSSVEKKSLHCIFVLMTQNTIKFPL